MLEKGKQPYLGRLDTLKTNSQNMRHSVSIG
jgi:hypothetical protein